MPTSFPLCLSHVIPFLTVPTVPFLSYPFLLVPTIPSLSFLSLRCHSFLPVPECQTFLPILPKPTFLPCICYDTRFLSVSTMPILSSLSLQYKPFLVPPCPYNAHPFLPVPKLPTCSFLSLQCSPFPPCLYNSVQPFLVASTTSNLPHCPSLSSLSLQSHPFPSCPYNACPPFLPVLTMPTFPACPCNKKTLPSMPNSETPCVVSCLGQPSQQVLPACFVLARKSLAEIPRASVSLLVQNHHLVGAQQGKKKNSAKYPAAFEVPRFSRPFFQMWSIVIGARGLKWSTSHPPPLVIYIGTPNLPSIKNTTFLLHNSKYCIVII